MTRSSRLALVLGGTRSGKSVEAERLVTAWAAGAPVTYVATARLEGLDDASLAQRVADHRARRPSSWRTVEVGDDLAADLLSVSGPVLLDSIGPWVAPAWPDVPAIEPVVEALLHRDGDTVVVSDEVGLAVHPPSDMGRWFVDAIGTVNQAIAAVADDVRLVVAGRVLILPPAVGGD